MTERPLLHPMPPTDATPSTSWCDRHYRSALMVLLAVSFALRVWLASTGGQGYWPDEMRYSFSAREAASQFSHGNSRDAWLALIGTADHLLFKISGVPVALWELHHGQNAILVASWFGMFSVIAIGLVAAIARSAGAGARESLLAAFFAAGANSLFYYSRHYFPYDLSLALCLLALWTTWQSRTWWQSIGAGFFAGLGFLTYNGYWLLGGAILAFHVLRGGSWLRVLVRGLCAGVGLICPLLVAVAAARALNRDLIASFREFSHSITQGDFGGGWRQVWAYLWDAEGLMLIVWLSLAIGAVFKLKNTGLRRLVVWLGAVFVLYVGLVVCADVLRVFVVYGRTARMLVPFLCLAAAAGAEGLAPIFPERGKFVALLVAVLVIAAAHMGAALRQIFPGEFIRIAAARALNERNHSPALLRVMNANRLSEGIVTSEPRPHQVILREAHPLQFAPFLYEGFGEEMRRILRAQDISMQLVAVPGVALPDIGGGYPGPLRLRIKFPHNRAGIAEPLLTSGTTGKANFVFVQYIDVNHVRIGYDCWGAGGLLGEPLAVDLSQAHDVMISSGGQLPGTNEFPQAVDGADWGRLKANVVVTIDGQMALVGRSASNPVDPRTVFVGTNLAGGSTARDEFSGEIVGVDQAPWSDVLAQLPLEKLTADVVARRINEVSPDADWEGFPGPLRLRVRVPQGAAGQADPLIVTGVPGAGDFVYVRYLADGRLRFGFDHWGFGGLESAPVTVDKSRQVELVVSYGGLMPGPMGKLYTRSPEIKALREQVVIVVDGQVVLHAPANSFPSNASQITAGRNEIGGSTTKADFGGEIYVVKSEAANAVLQLPEVARLPP